VPDLLACVEIQGGTCIAEHVQDLATHLRLLADPDGYRPERCGCCLGRVLHVHDYPERTLFGEPGLSPVIRILRFICASPSCRATWRILPAFVARHLWRVWQTVERTTQPAKPPVLDPAPVPGGLRGAGGSACVGGQAARAAARNQQRRPARDDR